MVTSRNLRLLSVYLFKRKNFKGHIKASLVETTAIFGDPFAAENKNSNFQLKIKSVVLIRSGNRDNLGIIFPTTP